MDRKTMMLKIADLGLARAFTLPIKKYTHEVTVVIISLYFTTRAHFISILYLLCAGYGRYWHCGIELLRYFWGLHITQQQWTCGPLAAFLVCLASEICGYLMQLRQTYSFLLLIHLSLWIVLFLAELVTKQALFPGDSELQQLLHIFRFSN